MPSAYALGIIHGTVVVPIPSHVRGVTLLQHRQAKAWWNNHLQAAAEDPINNGQFITYRPI